MIPYEDIADLVNRCADPQMPLGIRQAAERVREWIHAPIPLVLPSGTILHPNKPPREIVAGDTWTKRASQKMSNHRPTVIVLRVYRKAYTTMIEHSAGTQTERTFRRDYE